MSWWDLRKKRKKTCTVCNTNKLPKEPATIRLDVQEGTVEILICDECAEFFDKSSEVLNRGKNEPV